MKVKLFHLFYITLFLAVCLLPFVGMVLLGPSDGSEAEKPRLLTDDGGINPAYLEDAEEYIAEGFALRPELRTLWAQLNASLFRTGVDDRVILGSDGWLYGGATADDYMGVTMDDTELTYAAGNLALMQEYAQSRGARFLFTIAPNKNSLYPNNMPAYYPAGTVSNAVLLTEKLAERNVGYADLFTVFRQEESVLYYKTDSRWTTQGAALAADTILQQLHKSTSYFDGTFLTKTYCTGDLYRLLYPTGPEVELVDSYAKGFTYAYTDEGGERAVTTAQTNVRGSLLCLHDGIGNALRPYLAEVYEGAMFSDAPVYDLTAIGERAADTVVVERSECSLRKLVETAPILPAPVRKVTSESFGAETLSAVGSTVGELTGLTVTVPKSLVDSGSGLYVKIGDTVYEGCVLCGEDVLVCSAYVTEELPKVVELIVLTDGVYTTYSCIVSG